MTHPSQNTLLCSACMPTRKTPLYLEEAPVADRISSPSAPLPLSPMLFSPLHMNSPPFS
ncbi:hypothetical protein E2C01_076966 [Portunus trituberculatus]|uniref:Uncharacterized protein n=1 Tax=Portunus trituberculatus TaxID=210409 RepID=A0A5B7INB5_PORTR|nr:hypothetical protein [Portunus trituberculatus]